MKVIIAGSRGIVNTANVFNKLSLSSIDITEVVCGEAQGVDRLGKQWAKGQGIPVKSFPAEWDKYGKSAGYRRNVDMADYADALIAIWDGESKGTQHMIDIAQGKGLQVELYRL